MHNNYKYKDYITPILFIALEFVLLHNSKIVTTSIINSLKIFIYNIFPSLLPTMVVGNILVKNNIFIIIPRFIKKVFYNIFMFNDEMINIYIMSLFCGAPTNFLFINNAYNENVINDEEADTLLRCTNFVNPLFIITTSNVIFAKKFVGILTIILMVISSLLKAFLLKSKRKQRKISKNNENFFITFNKSIKESINSLLNIFIIFICFNILISLINEIFLLNETTLTLLNGILEMTSGIMKIRYLNINFLLKYLMYIFFLLFGGLSIHMQSFSMLKNKKIRYLKYFIFRLF